MGDVGSGFSGRISIQVLRNACQLPFLCMDSLSSVALSNFRGCLLKRHVDLRSNLPLHLQGTIQLVAPVAVSSCRLRYFIDVARKGV